LAFLLSTDSPQIACAQPTHQVAWLAHLPYTHAMIEKVGYTRPITSARPLKKAGSVAGAGFADVLAAAESTAGAESAEAPGSLAPMGGLGGLLGAQEVDEREARRHKAAKRGKLTLDVLANLRDALLIGTLPYPVIRQLEQLVAQERGDATDPELMSILNEIEVRAAVELAKLEMSGLLPPLATAP